MPFQPQALTLDTLKRMGQRLARACLAKYPQIPLARHQALELVAAAIGFENWHAAQQSLSAQENPSVNPVTVEEGFPQPTVLIERSGAVTSIPVSEQEVGDVVWVNGALTSADQFEPLKGFSIQLRAQDEGWNLDPAARHQFSAWLMPRHEGFQEGDKSAVLLVIDDALLSNVERLGVIREQITRRYDIDKTWSTSTKRLMSLRYDLSSVKQGVMSSMEALDFGSEADGLLMKLGHRKAPAFANKKNEKDHERRLQPLLFKVAQSLTVLRLELLKRSTPKQWADFEKDCHHALNHDCKEEMLRTDLKARLVCQVYLLVKTNGYLVSSGWWDNMSKPQRRALKKSLLAAMSKENLETEQPLDKKYFARLRRRAKKRAQSKREEG